MIPTIIIALLTVTTITLSILFFPHIKIGKITLDTYWIIALIGASILLIFNLSPIEEVFNQLTANTSINPLKILVLFFSMTILSIYLDELGLFKFLAVAFAHKAKGNQTLLFFILYGLTAILTIFTSNDIVILTLTPFICFFCKNSKIKPLPYLIAEFAAANTWSLMFIIGNPTNIYLASSAGIDFVSYFKVMAIPTIAAGLSELLILFLLFKNKLKEPLCPSEEDCHIENKLDLIIGIAHLAVCLIFLIISSYINVEMYLVSLICASSLLLISLIIRLISKKNWTYITHSLTRLPYQLIPFFLSMFVIVVAINYQGITDQIATILGTTNVIWVYGFTSFFASNIINNIPMSILYSNLSVSLTGENYISAIFASIIGSNIGAFLTPIGALAGIMFSSLVNKNDIRFTFKDFTKYGLIIALPTIAIALSALLVVEMVS